MVMHKNMIADSEPLLQNDFGDVNDCSLTAITFLLFRIYTLAEPAELYDIVLSNSLHKGYEVATGTKVAKIPGIIRRCLVELNDPQIKVKARYTRFLFNMKTIRRLIDKNIDVLLCLQKHPKYKNHTVNVIGYEGTDLIIYDNWDKEMHSIPFSEVHISASIMWAVQ